MSCDSVSPLRVSKVEAALLLFSWIHDRVRCLHEWYMFLCCKLLLFSVYSLVILLQFDWPLLLMMLSACIKTDWAAPVSSLGTSSCYDHRAQCWKSYYATGSWFFYQFNRINSILLENDWHIYNVFCRLDFLLLLSYMNQQIHILVSCNNCSCLQVLFHLGGIYCFRVFLSYCTFYEKKVP